MHRRSTYRILIHNVLSKHGACIFDEIRNHIKKDYGPRIADSTLTETLKIMITEKEIDVQEYSQKAHLKPIRCYTLTEKYYLKEFRSALADIAEEIDLPIVAPFIPPFFNVPPETEEKRAELPGLFRATFDRFASELQKKMFEFKRPWQEVKHVVAHLLWVSCQKRLKSLDELMDKYGSRGDVDISETIKDWSSAKTLKQFLEFEGTHNWGVEIRSVLMENFPRIYSTTLQYPEYKWLLLENTISRLDYREAEEVGGSVEESIALLAKPKNQKMLTDFFRKVDEISFALIVSVGRKKIDQALWNGLLKDFDHWMKDLTNGQLDPRELEWVFKNGLKNLDMFRRIVRKKEVQKYIDNILTNAKIPHYGTSKVWEMLIRSISKTRTLETFKLSPGRMWDLLYLYEYHPLGTKPDFYDEIYKKIDERRTQERIKDKEFNDSFDDLFQEK